MRPTVVTSPTQRCTFHGCRFAPVGMVVAERDTPTGKVRHRFPVCAVDRDFLIDRAMSAPNVERVVWMAREDWATDGESSAA